MRKTFLHLVCLENHLVGMTGPAAPHVFAFDRRADLPSSLALSSCLQDSQVINRPRSLTSFGTRRHAQAM